METKTCIYAVIWATVLSVTVCQKISILPKGEQIKQKGSGVIMSCNVEDFSSSDKIEMKWIGPRGDPIDSTSGRTYVERLSNTHLKLYIRSFGIVDSGLYECEAIIQGSSHMESALITLYENIEFDESLPTEVEHRVNSSPLLECRAEGQPQPKISWRFERQKISEDDEKYRFEPNGLRIFHLEKEDMGKYECRAAVPSQGALEVRKITLNVLYPPEIISGPTSVSVIEGTDITLKCDAQGNPGVKYEWYKEKKVSDVIKLKVRLDEGKPKYTIARARGDDEGRYFCKVSNDLGSKEASADVTLLVPPTLDKLPHKVQLEGNVMILHCRATGVPLPEITWQRVGAPHPYTPGEQRDDIRISIDNKQQGVSKLVIRGIRKSDAGKYLCTANNEAGVAKSNATLSVEYKPSITSTDVAAHGWAGQVRNFTCKGEGEPTPSIKWFRQKDRFIGRNRTFSIFNGRGTSTLQIKIGENQDWIYGSYSCYAKNYHGVVTKSFNLQQAYPPDMPRNVTVTKETPTSVILTADKPKRTGGLVIDTWMIKYDQTQPLDGEQPDSNTVYFKEGATMRIEGLKEATIYNFIMSCGNPVGFGKEVKFKVRTPGIPPQKEKEKQADMPPAKKPEEVSYNTGPVNSTVVQKPTDRNHSADILVRKTRVKEKEGLNTMFVIIGGAIIVFILMLVGCILIVIIVKRRSSRRGQGGRKKSKNVTVDDAKEIELQVPIDRKDSPMVERSRRRPQHPGSPVPPHSNTIPRANGHPRTENPGGHHTMGKSSNNGVNYVLNTSHSQQKLAWEQMMLNAGGQSEDELENGALCGETGQPQMHHTLPHGHPHSHPQAPQHHHHHHHHPMDPCPGGGFPQQQHPQQHHMMMGAGTHPGPNHHYNHHPNQQAPLKQHGQIQKVNSIQDRDLPPPPPFLLDDNYNTSGSPSYHDVLDGYCSGDNVDDCLDEEDLDIRVPSYYDDREPHPNSQYAVT